MATAYLRVKKWNEFQHYKKRNPPWIKLHQALLSNYDYAGLPDAAKAHLMGVWLLASQMGGKVPCDPEFVANKISAKEPVNLQLLVDADFLEPVDERASKMLAKRYQDAPVTARSEEKRRDREESESEKKQTRPDSGDESGEGEQPERWMHDDYNEAFGRRLQLLPGRRRKYRAMYHEHLEGRDDPRQAWWWVLQTVRASDHHMSNPDYHDPDSFLNKPERRERWMLKAEDAARHGTLGLSDADKKVVNLRQKMEGWDLGGAG